VFTERGHIASE